MRCFVIILALCVIAPAPIAFSPAAATQKKIQPRKPDLADLVSGTYDGDVVADTRGGSQSDVEITVTRVAKNVVEIACDYERVPTVRIGLTAAGQAIIAAHPGDGFLIERDKDPARLDLSIDGATLVVHKQ